MTRYFKEPSAWAPLRTKQFMAVQQQMFFHKLAISEIKSRLGKHCTFLSHLEKGGNIWFLAHVMIDGKKRVIKFDTGKTAASELEAENYKALKSQIDDYVTGKKNI